VHVQIFLIDHVLIHEQLGISKEGTMDVVNATFDEAKTTLKKITSPHAFVKNERWSTFHMKEEFHVRFVAILQIIYQQEKLAYFSNRIAITFDMANKGQLMNWCSIVLTKFLVKFTCWTKCKKKTTNPVFNMTKTNNCYSGLILDILFKKRFPLFKVPSPRTTTLEELMSPVS